MYQNIAKQEKYWDKEVESFDSIYSHQKGKLSNFLDKKLRWDMYERFNYTIKNSEPIEGSTIFDIGCGTGRFALEYAKRKAKKVIGIDISQNMVDVCIKRANKEDSASICNFIKSEPLGYITEEKFDISIGIGLFDYIKDAVPVIEKMKTVTLKKIIVTFPRKKSLRALIRKFRLSFKGCDVYFYDEKDIHRIFSETGIKNYSFEIIGQLYCVTAIPI